MTLNRNNPQPPPLAPLQRKEIMRPSNILLPRIRQPHLHSPKQVPDREVQFHHREFAAHAASGAFAEGGEEAF